MTEKTYGGITPHTVKNTSAEKLNASQFIQKMKKENSLKDEEGEALDIEKLKRAGDIAKEVKKYASQIIKKDVLLLEIAEKIEARIFQLGGKPAFPVNLSINEIAAHATPVHNDIERARGLLKVDLGVQVDGFIADTAYTIDLEDIPEHKMLIDAAEAGLKAAVHIIVAGVELREIGHVIEGEIRKRNVRPIINLSGHAIGRYNLHAGITIPNYDNAQTYALEEGSYAIEPFTTTGAGKVKDGKRSGIYHVENDLPVRDASAREMLKYIKEEYVTLPFCTRWLVKKYGVRATLSLKRLEEAGILHHYPQLIEIDRKPVAQAEHTVILTKKEKIITT